MTAREWLDSCRAAARTVEPAMRELSALEDARDAGAAWETSQASAGAAHGAHSDPTASSAERRMAELDEMIADRAHGIEDSLATVGAVLSVLPEMADALGERHADAIETYYVDCAETWSEVSWELGVSVRTVYAMRVAAYAWLDARRPWMCA